MVGRLQERALVRLVPVWEAQLDPVSYNEDQNSENYGAVSMYSFTEIPVQQQRSGQPGRIINVHPDRVIILAEGSDDGRLDSGESLLEEGSTSCWTSKSFGRCGGRVPEERQPATQL